MKKSKTHELSKRLLFTILILAVYMAGRSLLLYNVDSAAYQSEELDSQNIVVSMVSGDIHQYTLFALGIMPSIMASLFMWIYMAVRGTEYKARTSPQKTQRLTMAAMVIIAFAFAVSRAERLIFKESVLDIEILKAIAVLEMTIGAIIIYKMSNLNKEHGIGAQMPIIVVNILDNFISTIRKHTWEELYRPFLLCLMMATIALVMENVNIRLRVQRVSIHNEYADKSYIAFKFDPIGMMPVMFAVTFFMLPQLILRFLLFLDKDNAALQYIYERLSLTDVMGVAVYLGIIFLLNVLFSFIMLSPGEMAGQLQKGGDSIVNIYAGRKTKKYLRKKVFLLSVSSGVVMCLMMGISLFLSLRGEISPQLAMLPMTGMFLTGMSCGLYREVRTYWKFDSYSFFI